MPSELRRARRLAFACLPLLLGACGTMDDSSMTASGQVQESATARAASAPASSAPTAEPTTASPVQSTASNAPTVHVNETEGWSIVVPPGWEIVAQRDCCVALHRDGVIAEVLVAPSSGLTLEALEAQKVDDLSTWPGVVGIESDFVSLPAGDAVRVTVASELDTGSQVFDLHVIEQGDTQYLISVRGPQGDSQLLADAESLAESFAILD
jgi:hypothetical protein